MAVKDGTRCIGDRILRIVAFGQYRIESGDLTATIGTVAGALDKLRQSCKHRGRVAASDRRFTDSQRNLALRHGIAGERIHDQQDMPTLIAKIFGNRGGVSGPPAGASAG